jgi:hypothetical protein
MYIYTTFPNLLRGCAVSHCLALRYLFTKRRYLRFNLVNEIKIFLTPKKRIPTFQFLTVVQVMSISIGIRFIVCAFVCYPVTTKALQCPNPPFKICYVNQNVHFIKSVKYLKFYGFKNCIEKQSIYVLLMQDGRETLLLPKKGLRVEKVRKQGTKVIS